MLKSSRMVRNVAIRRYGGIMLPGLGHHSGQSVRMPLAILQLFIQKRQVDLQHPRNRADDPEGGAQGLSPRIFCTTLSGTRDCFATCATLTCLRNRALSSNAPSKRFLVAMSFLTIQGRDEQHIENIHQKFSLSTSFFIYFSLTTYLDCGILLFRWTTREGPGGEQGRCQ